MSILSKLVPLIVLALCLVFAAFVGYAIYTIATDVADKTSKKMEKKNVSFGKEGMKIGVKEVRTENYVDQTQRYGMIPGIDTLFWSSADAKSQELLRLRKITCGTNASSHSHTARCDKANVRVIS